MNKGHSRFRAQATRRLSLSSPLLASRTRIDRSTPERRRPMRVREARSGDDKLSRLVACARKRECPLFICACGAARVSLFQNDTRAGNSREREVFHRSPNLASSRRLRNARCRKQEQECGKQPARLRPAMNWGKGWHQQLTIRMPTWQRSAQICTKLSAGNGRKIASKGVGQGRLVESRCLMNSILIVDDEADIRKSLRGVLEDEGYKVAAAESGEACVEALKSRSFDVVLLDIWLPGMDGLETLEKIKQQEDAPEVIIISGHGTIETAVKATKLGAYDFLEKPLSLERTLIVLKNAMQARKLRGEN